MQFTESFIFSGNGWALMGAIDALISLKLFTNMENNENYQKLLENFQHHAGNLSLLQDSDKGLWHNILDDPDSFMETSASAMFMYAYLKGVEHNFLDASIYEQIICKTWQGLKERIDFDGTISGIIGETGIKDTAEDYGPQNTKYSHSSPGLGSVLRAVAAIVNS